jgi:hypothetical protein
MQTGNLPGPEDARGFLRRHGLLIDRQSPFNLVGRLKIDQLRAVQDGLELERIAGAFNIPVCVVRASMKQNS